MKWILIFWLMVDRGGGPAVAEFSTENRCHAAGKAILEAARYHGDTIKRPNTGNYICVPQ